MFKCNDCGKNTKKMFKKIVGKRPKEYYNALFRKNNRKNKIIIHTKNKDLFGQLKNEKYIFVKEWITKGWEIVKELSLCEDCYEK